MLMTVDGFMAILLQKNLGSLLHNPKTDANDITQDTVVSNEDDRGTMCGKRASYS